MPSTNRMIASIALLPAAAVIAQARDDFSPPADYYINATASDPGLKAQLRAIIGRNYWNPASTSHLVRNYDSARLSLHILHRDPADSSRIILIYSGVSVPGAWDAGLTWNREHTWPDSRGLGGSGPDYTDLHQLRPCNPSVNSSRGNNPFGIGGGYWDPQPSTNPYFTGFGSGAFVPGTNDRGEMARAMFYMDTRYDGTDPQTTDLTLVNGFPSGNQMGDLARLLEWHYEDPVNETERLRNHLIFSNTDNPLYYQGNRNPFVDRPEFVWAIWGTSPNSSTIFTGAAPMPDGSSFDTANFRVIVGSAPGQRIVSVSKIGATPTTFDVTFTGPFIVAGAGQGRAFAAGPRSTDLVIAPESTDTVGVFTGEITIDNTDLTSAGAGRGNADADDVILMLSEVLTSANPSLSASEDIDAGIVMSNFTPNSGVRMIQAVVHNFGYSPTTALLDIDAVSGGSLPFGVVSDIASGIGAAPGVITLSFDTSGAAPGSQSRTFHIHTSDEDIPGETIDLLELTWQVTIVPPVPGDCFGDADGNLLIDFGDITSVLANWGGGAGPGDADGNGVVNFQDITAVLSRFGAHCD